MNRTELTLARRLAWKAEGRQRVSPAVGVAVAGVALAIVVMLLAVAVVLGFKREVTARVFAANDAVTIRAYTLDGGADTFDAAAVLAVLSLPEGVEVAEEVEVQGILKTDSDFLGANFSADPAVEGNGLIVSQSIAAKLGLTRGDRIPAYFVLNGRIRTRAFIVDSIYSTGIAEHDDLVAYCSPEVPRALLNIPEGEVQALGLRNVAPERVEELASAVHGQLLSAYYSGQIGGAYTVTTVFQTNANLFSWLDLLDTNVVVILVLMGLVAAFTLISSLFIIILERVRTIGLLKALGADNGQVRRIFRLMATRLVLRGMAAGNALGLGLIALQYFTHALPLDEESYFVDYVPVAFSLPGILLLNAGVLAVSWLVLMLPALIIARISPATTMRYE